MQSITLEVILSAVFGVGEERRDELRRRLIAILGETQSPAAIGITFPVLRRLPRYKRIRALLAETDALLAAEIGERRADPELERREDILSMLVAARYDDGEGMDDGEIRDQLMTLLMAGHETTATSLAWALELLFRSPGAHGARFATRSPGTRPPTWTRLSRRACACGPWCRSPAGF